MKWIPDGVATKEIKRLWRTKMVKKYNYKCPYCKGIVTVEGADITLLHCPYCGANMRGEYHE